ncbi:MAG: hypothetical protein IKX21_00040 [Deltaproteobacteria bacterium]|nr:hypothetical protein [Deltaproteobacteria bacterium]
MKKCFLLRPALLLGLLAASACVPHPASAPLSSMTLQQEQISLALCYTRKGAQPLPLAGAFLRDPRHPDQADLGLALVTGQRFAHCRSTNGTVSCENAAGQSHAQAAAVFMAQCVAQALSAHDGASTSSSPVFLQETAERRHVCQSGKHSLELRIISEKE